MQIKEIKLKTVCSITLADRVMTMDQSWLNTMMADLELEFAAAWTEVRMKVVKGALVVALVVGEVVMGGRETMKER